MIERCFSFIIIISFLSVIRDVIVRWEKIMDGLG